MALEMTSGWGEDEKEVDSVEERFWKGNGCRTIRCTAWTGFFFSASIDAVGRRRVSSGGMAKVGAFDRTSRGFLHRKGTVFGEADVKQVLHQVYAAKDLRSSRRTSDRIA